MRPFLCILATWALVLGQPSVLVAQDSTPKQAPEETRLPPETEKKDTPVLDRGKLLGELYARLGSTKDKESAKLVADAIEKLWLASGSDTVDVLMGRAMLLVEKEDLDVALKILNSVVDIAPDFAEGWNQRATLYFLKKDYQSSMQDLRRVLRLDPKHYKAISGLGLILQELGDKKSALMAFRQAMQVHPFLGNVEQSTRELERDVEGQGI